MINEFWQDKPDIAGLATSSIIFYNPHLLHTVYRFLEGYSLTWDTTSSVVGLVSKLTDEAIDKFGS